MKSTAGYLLLALVVTAAVFAAVMTAHPDNRRRNFLFPGGSDMADSPAYWALEPGAPLPGGVTRQPPVPGTVAADEDVLPFGPQRAGYQDAETEMRLAGRHVQMPAAYQPGADDQPIITRGQQLFGTYCAVCHGPTGAGDGTLASYKEFSSVAFSLGARAKELNDGELFYLISRGGRGGVMASYAVQTTPAERWQLVRFLRTLPGATDPPPGDGNPNGNSNSNGQGE